MQFLPIILMLMIYPTYPYKTTSRFKIYNSLDKENWTALVSGPMPLVENKTDFIVFI